MPLLSRPILIVIVGCLCVSRGLAAAPDFDRDVRPILAGHCYECHGPDKAKSGLRLSDRDAALRPAKSGKAAIVPGKPDASELIRRVTTADVDDHMPPEKAPLSAAQVEVLRRWVADGAPYPPHWAYQPIRRPAPPAVKDGAPARNAIDAFVLARLDAAGVAPSPEADRYTLIKRLYADLLGLPPTPAEVDAFVADSSPGAYDALVDRLLASPHFGERWGRHWLDAARYADSDGYEKDLPRPDAWRFRDWVIDAINADLPYDRFTVEQLAGDLLPGASDAQKVATAFHRQTLTNREGGVDAEQFRVEATFDRAETTGAVWLGLTVGCARCHNHKYDAIAQREYYQLFAFFNDADEADLALPVAAEEIAHYKRDLAAHQAKVKPLEAKVAELKKANSKDAVAAAEKDLAALKRTQPKDPTPIVRVMGRAKAPRKTTILSRGDFLRPEGSVSAGALATLHPLRPRDPAAGADRLDLAHWLVDPANPLTARVAVNQIWSHLFGAGLVRTVGDFGVRGERPSHPELLDFLAAGFRDDGWSRKRLIRTIVTSATYRQSSAHRPDAAQVDPENRLLSRQNRMRVEGEIVRDLALAAAGLLSPKVGGPSVFPPMPPDVAALSYANNFRWTPSEGEDRYRRGMYTFFKRTVPYPSLIAFDCPDSNAAMVSRATSNTPLQALTMLNNETFAEAARAMGKRLVEAKVSGDSARLALGLRQCVARPPAAQELAEFAALLAKCRSYYAARPDEATRAIGEYASPAVPAAESAAWVATARVFLNLDEFMTRE